MRLLSLGQRFSPSEWPDGRYSARPKGRNGSRFVASFGNWQALSAAVVLALFALAITVGCHRSTYRQKADNEVANLLALGQRDQRWKLRDSQIYPDKQSRHYDPFSPDAEPMPPDDPVSHQLMHSVDGKKGWPHWHDNGDTVYVENPFWRAYLPRNEQGVVVLDRGRAVDLALVHSRDYQRQLENLYLSALTVTAERFRFDVQFFGGHSTFFTSNGSKRAGGPQSLLELDTDAQATKLGATGAEMLIGFANSLVWQYSGGDSYASASLLNFSLMQPLLRAGGRAVVLESLTQAERNLLANIRQMAHYQRGFYLQVITGSSPGTGPSSGGLAISSLSPAVSPGRGGVLSLLQSQVQIRNQQQNVAGLEDSYEQLLAAHLADRIDRYQVDLALQSLYNAQSQLLSLRSSYQTQLDNFKISLGLPPDLPVEISDDLLRRFDFMDPKLLDLQRRTTLLLRALRDPATPEPPDWLQQMQNIAQQIEEQVETVRHDIDQLTQLLQERATLLREFYSAERRQEEGTELITDAEKAIKDLQERYQNIVADFELMLEGKLPAPRGEQRTPRESMKNLLQQLNEFTQDPDRIVAEQIGQLETQIEDLQGQLAKAQKQVAALSEQMTKASPEELSALEEKFTTARTDVEIIQSRLDSANRTLEELKKTPKEQIAMQILDPILLQISDLSLIQARARLDTIMLTPVDISPEEALEIARQNRLDWMNARAALVDQWRQIEIMANRLRSNLDVTFSGDVQTVGDNPFAFDSNTGQLRIGFRFDAPFTRLVERNQYRTALISFQRARRDYMAFEDQVMQSLRETLRNIRLNQNTFELLRSAVLVAIAQVDLARERLREPPRAGQTSQFGVNTARDLVQALSSLLNAQNAILGAWVQYEIQRMLLDFQMGTMQLDDRGHWIDPGPILSRQAQENPFQPETGPVPGGTEARPQTEPQPQQLVTQEGGTQEGSMQESGTREGSTQEGGTAQPGQHALAGTILDREHAAPQAATGLADRLPATQATISGQPTEAHAEADAGENLSPTMQRLRDRLASYGGNGHLAGQQQAATPPESAQPSGQSPQTQARPVSHMTPQPSNPTLTPGPATQQSALPPAPWVARSAPLNQATVDPYAQDLPESLWPSIQALLEMEEMEDDAGITVISDGPDSSK